MKKSNKILKTILTFFSFFILSCTTVENIYVLPAADGNAVFLRPVTISNKKNEISNLQFDITAITDSQEIISNPAIKYTFSSKNLNTAMTAKICIKNDFSELEFQNPQIIFKQLNSSKGFDVRFSAEIEKDRFVEFLDSNTPAKIVIKYSDGKEEILESKDFNNKLNEMRLILL